MINYREIDAENWSRLKHMARSPMYYQHCLAHPIQQTPAMLLGAAVHCIVLEGPGVFETRYAALPDFGDMRTTKGKLAKAEWETREAELTGETGDARIPLTSSQVAMCGAIKFAVNANPHAKELVADVKPEQHFLWTDSETGIKCKGQQDGIGDGFQLSLKTTRAESPEHFGREYFQRMYHGQTAYYVDGYNSATQQDLPEVMVVVQNLPPFDCWVLDVPAVAVDEGRDLYGKLLDRLKQCLQYDTPWPGAVPTRDALHIPPWAVHGENETDIDALDLEA